MLCDFHCEREQDPVSLPTDTSIYATANTLEFHWQGIFKEPDISYLACDKMGVYHENTK